MTTLDTITPEWAAACPAWGSNDVRERRTDDVSMTQRVDDVAHCLPARPQPRQMRHPRSTN